MAIYQYRVRDQQGKVIKGLMEASSESFVVDKLKLSGYYITSIQQKEVSRRRRAILYNQLKVTRRALTQYLGVVNIILDFGLPLDASLEILSEQIKHPLLKRATDSIKIEVEKGSTLAAALDKYPDIFSEMFRATIRTGEAKGQLKEVIKELTLYYEQEGEIREKISSDLGYPFLVLVFSSVMLIGLLGVVMPHFTKIINAIPLELPQVTKGILDLGNFIHAYYIGIGVVFLSFGGFYHKVLLRGKGKFYRDKFILKIPILGEVSRKLAFARAYLAFAALIKSGLSTDAAVALTKTFVSNQVIAEELQTIFKEIQNPENLSFPQEARVLLPSDLKLMVLGERAMSLGTVIEKMADLHLKEVYYLIHYYLRNGLLLLICLILVLMIGIIMSVDIPLFDWGAKVIRN